MYHLFIKCLFLCSLFQNYACETGAAPSTYEAFYQWAGEISHVVTTRDHIAGDFYIRVSYNQQQHKINVRKQTLGAPGRVQIAPLDQVLPAFEYATDMRF